MSTLKSARQINANRGTSVKLLAKATIVFASLGAAGPAHGQCLNRPASLLLPPGLKLTIRTEKPVAEISRPVTILVELTNQTNRPISLTDRLSTERDYELHVRDSTGKEPALTTLGKAMRSPIIGSHSQSKVELAPGETYTGKEDLAGVYAITIPGTYTVEACRDLIGWG